MGLLLTVTRSDQNDSTAYSGWNDLNVPNVAGSGYREIRALWRKATNDHQADVAMDDSGVMNGACIVNIRGASNVRLIAEAYGSGDGDKVSFASGETIDDNSLVLIAVALGGDTDMSQLVGFANEGLTDIVTHVAAHSAAASGLGLYVCTGTREFAGRLLKTVMTTLAPSAAFRAAVFAFEP